MKKMGIERTACKREQNEKGDKEDRKILERDGEAVKTKRGWGWRKEGGSEQRKEPLRKDK